MIQYIIMNQDYRPLPEAAIKAWKRAAVLPFYKKILAKNGLEPTSIKTAEDFLKLAPIISKEDIFLDAMPEDLSAEPVSELASAIVSSGTSGTFSYGLIMKKDLGRQREAIDSMLNYFFQADKIKPLIINALPMGVSFFSSYPVIPTSVRTDIANQIVKKFAKHFGQIIVITDPHVAKKMIEEGLETGIDWTALKISFVIGGAGTSSSFESYLQSLVGAGKIFCTMGITEIGLNLFYAAPELIGLRSEIQKNPEVLEKLFGQRIACPEIFAYDPQRVFVEIKNPDANGFGNIVLTSLDENNPTPLPRYDTGDFGKIIPDGAIPQVPVEMPLIAVVGRVGDWLISDNRQIGPDTIKELLYQNSSIAGKITDHFFMSNKNGLEISVQLKKNASLSASDKEKLAKLSIIGVQYENYNHAMTLDYEIKWKHVDR